MKPPFSVTVPPGVVTIMSTAPAAWAEIVAVRLVELVTLTLVAATPPMLTVVLPATKLVPAMVTDVPPEAPPKLGAIVRGAAEEL